MAIKIEKPIVDYKVLQSGPPEPKARKADSSQELDLAEVVQMHEQLERPFKLLGSTYKIKTPLSEHAMYVTINDIILNEGTEHELRRPFEVFINSKNMDHFQWIVALTRIISAVFRKGGDVTFLVEELYSVFDPKGGYFKKGGRYMPSLVAELGTVIEQHLIDIGLLEKEELDEHQQAHVEEARAKFEKAQARSHPEAKARTDAKTEDPVPDPAVGPGVDEFPAGATLCARCNTKAMVQMDGCLTCLNCGESKCA